MPEGELEKAKKQRTIAIIVTFSVLAALLVAVAITLAVLLTEECCLSDDEEDEIEEKLEDIRKVNQQTVSAPVEGLKIEENPKDGRMFDFRSEYVAENEFVINVRRLDKPTGWKKPIKIKYAIGEQKREKKLQPSETNEAKIKVPTDLPLRKENISYKQKIPFTIFQTWKSNMVPVQMKNAMLSVAEKNPEYQHRFFTDEDCRKLISDRFGNKVLAAFDILIPGAFKADLFRYCALYALGGVYLDCKMICKQPFRQHLKKTDEFVFVRDMNSSNMFNAFIASTAGNPVLKRCIDQCVENALERRFFGDPLQYTGPVLMGECFNMHFYGTRKRTIEVEDKPNFQIWIHPNEMNFLRVENSKGEVIILKNYPGYQQHIAQHYSGLAHSNMVYSWTRLKERCRQEFIFYNLRRKYLPYLREHFDSTSLPKSGSNAVVIVEPRSHEYLEFVILNSVYFFPGWTLFIFHSEENETFVRNILRDNVDNAHLICFSKGNISDMGVYNRLLTSAEFYEKIDAEMILVTQTDAFARRKGIEEFLQYDYVGAPWHNRRVGNGGFSLRRKLAMLDIIRRQPYKETENEDVYFSDACYNMEKRVAPFEVAKLFSSETLYSEDPLGIHGGGTWFYDDDMLFVMTVRVPVFHSLRPVPFNPTKSQIPKVIYQTYKQNQVFIGMFEAMKTFRNQNPDHQFRFFDDAACREFISNYFDSSVLFAYDDLIPGAYKADLFRYCVLYTEGGVYIDARMSCLVPISLYIYPHDTFVTSIDDGVTGAAYNAFISCVPKHPILKIAIDMVVKRVTAREYGSSPLYPTGPLLFGDAINTFLGRPKGSALQETIYKKDGKEVKLLTRKDPKDIASINRMYAEGFHSPVGYIYFEGTPVILTKYPRFQKERDIDLAGLGSYGDLWKEKKIYRDA